MPSKDLDLQFDQSCVARHKPGLRSLLTAVGLDVVYERADGDLLYYRETSGDEVAILDLVGGYGTLLLGHRHPELIAAATRFLASGKVNHAQGSIRQGAEQLAQLLNARVGGDHCTLFANSGTEAVEAALKHALLETQGQTLIALDGGFHGKTLGALQVTSNPHFREPFGCRSLNVVRVTPNDIDQLNTTFDRVDQPAAFVYEPIQGEAGVRPLTAEFVQAAAELCAEKNIPLIADESQTGLARTGSFLASQALGVVPDYIVLSKALGGGLAKISALMIDRKRYRPEFDLIHSSTFADDEFSCAIAAKVLELVDDDAIARCRCQGNFLRAQLRLLQKQYPNVIADVRGQGLMIGIELQPPEQEAGFLLNHLADRNLLGPLLSSFLLNEHHIRIAPTLSDSFTLRVQPSILVQQRQLERAVAALADVCAKIAANDVVGLLRFLAKETAVIGTIPTRSTDTPIYRYRKDRSSQQQNVDVRTGKAPRRVAWVFHLIDESDLAHMDAALENLTAKEKSAFFDRWSSLCEPVVMDTVDIQSATDEVVRLYPILLPVTSAWMLKNSRGRGLSKATTLVQKAVDAAAALHCDVVSLGQFTSIVTHRGGSLQDRNLHITTGNNYTTALVTQAIRAELNQRSLDPKELTLGVIGAAGDIGSTCASMMAPDFRNCILAGSGRVGSLDRLKQVATEIPSAKVATSLRAMEDAHVVVCATNSTAAPIGPEHLHSRAIVCDVSVPATIRPRISDVLPQVTIVPGAIVALPRREHLGIPGFPLPIGFTYGCMAEGLLLGLDGGSPMQWTGPSSSRRVFEISQIAARHGFQVGEPSSSANLSESSS